MSNLSHSNLSSANEYSCQSLESPKLKMAKIHHDSKLKSEQLERIDAGSGDIMRYMKGMKKEGLPQD